VTGDPVPARLAAYYENLDAGRMEGAAAQYSDDAQYIVPFAGSQESDPPNVVGASELKAYFDRRGHLPYRHEILFSAVEGEHAFVEGVSVLAGSGHRDRSFVASVTLASDGRIRRYLAYAAASTIDPSPSTETRSDHDAHAVVDRYFNALREARFEEAAACFSEDCLYSHPPYRHTQIKDPNRVELHGRDALLANFNRRGPASFGYRMDAFVQRGPNAMFEQAVVGLPGGKDGLSMGSLTLAGDGLIRRYAAFYFDPA